ncbi:FoF1 ATP synthase subunit delta [Patescibacteria group bacterium]
MRRISARQYAISLWHALDEAEASQQGKIIKGLLKKLARNRQLKLTDRIIDIFTQYDDKQNQVVAVNLTTAHKLDSVEHVRQSLKQVLNQDVRLEPQVDEDIIGGAVIEYGDYRLDGSVKNQLKQLQEKFSK